MFLDTSGLLSVLSQGEPTHIRACELFDAAINRLTHNYVLAELVPLAQTRGVPRIDARGFEEEIRTGPNVETVWVDEALHQAAMDLLRRRLDKTYSLCDAVSFVLMRQRGIDEALTIDHHFEQEGFRKLLP
ncbi:MAG TPA: PIN domain-containing protein [Gemmataceae bacterium]|jgi:predicted nucleic acid-binding protein|nr:PIN domain-containing protein [Gemmataceae bacterium]